jgi:hypothetical protein
LLRAMSGHLRGDEASGFRPTIPTPEAQARWRRCKQLSPVQRDEAERLMADFIMTKSITICPTRYAAPVEQRAQVMRSRH